VKDGVQPLFSSDEILELKISMNLKEVIQDIEVRDEHEATLSYKLSDGNDETFKIKVMVRGKTRTNTKVCRFPPLKLNFKKKKVANTLFAGQNKLKLVTHCNSRAINEEYIVREYYVYKLHQLVTPYSFNVRLCKITYDDKEGKFDPTPHYGFLIEDIDDLAKRNGMKEFNDSIPNQELCNRVELDRLMLFQYMIGNLDWSVPYRHNFKLIAPKEKSLPIAVPYDFDYCGMINTSYAVVPQDMNVPNVRTRVFRGLCRQKGEYDKVLKYFQNLKPDIYAVYTESEYLSDKSKTSAIKYLDDFYKVLDKPKSFEQKIVRACRARHKHLFEYY
jgi:hypothetical protein